MALTIEVPGWKTLELEHAFLDVNGTLAELGVVSDAAKEKLRELSGSLEIHLVTSDTRGLAKDIAEDLGVRLTVISTLEGAAEAKLAVLRELGAERTAVFGNGANDALVLEEAALGIVIFGDAEGAAVTALQAADLAVRSIESGLDCLLEPIRLKSGLRR